MSKVNLMEELASNKTANYASSSTVLDDVKLLLAGDASKDRELLQALAPSSQLMRNEQEYAELQQLKKLDDQYGEVYTLNQIKTIAVKYRLRFLESKKFKGNMDVNALFKLKEFCSKHNISMDKWNIAAKFFILAPKEMFHLDKPINIDPILFYKIDETNYRVIHNWGGEFNASRALMNWRLRSEGHLTSHRFFCTLFISYTIILAIPIHFKWYHHVISIAAAGVISLLNAQTTPKENSSLYSENNWNEQIK